MLSGSCWFMVTHSIQRADTREHVHILYFCLFKNYLIKKGQDTPLHCQRPMTYILWPMCFWDTEVRDVGVDARGQSGLSACTNWMKWFCDSWFIRLKVETWSQPHVSPHARVSTHAERGYHFKAWTGKTRLRSERGMDKQVINRHIHLSLCEIWRVLKFLQRPYGTMHLEC